MSIIRAGGPGLGAAAIARLRTPAGHPEGYLEAFANIYVRLSDAIRDGVLQGKPFPTADDGIRSMVFVEAVLANSRGSAKWTRLDDVEAGIRSGRQ